jgi:NTE family protein
MKTIIENLVFSGGGVKGISFGGALKKLVQLESQGNLTLQLKDIMGVSIGSIVGLLFLIGYTPQEIEQCIVDLEIKHLKNVQLHNMMHYGLDTGARILTWIKDMLKQKDIDPSITMLSLFEKTGVNFRVVATNLDKRCQVIFDKYTYPEIQVLQAIRMSISIPFVFTKTRFNDEVYVDGCVLDNYPLHFYNDCLEKTLGFCITSFDETGYDKVGVSIDTFEEYIHSVLKCFLTRNEKQYFDDTYRKHTVFIYVKSISGINFDINLDTKISLLREGYLAVQDFFDEKNGVSNESGPNVHDSSSS